MQPEQKQSSRPMERVPLEALRREFARVLTTLGFSKEKRDRCARIFTNNTRDGVVSHGINRFPAFVELVRQGIVKVDADPTLVQASGAFERWDGCQGAGPTNAETCMNRAIELAHVHTIGAVALRNTNHWMRAGTYGLQAADAGCIGICWTNTTALMPPWGSDEPRLGNNPLVICVPHNPDHVLLDMSMSQFSFGRLAIARRSGEPLPVPGGYDIEGNLTTDAERITASKRPLPIGYWKGSGLALLLDCVVSLLAGGDATCDITNRKTETKVSQFFLAIDLAKAGAEGSEIVDRILSDVHSARALDPLQPIAFPGERTALRRQANLSEGVLVDSIIWKTVQSL